ncbi:DUF4214 domain-containing protein [Neoroseomonas soli]|uniref:DUF4214 domain-containing protein n=1 Tax=Neoroseomonas soli TaxID=1081025 RepID=A0A9X9WXN1_9PROT|nr:DUF4214 domain-containing protein [Neoroseomonas soli]MBR0671910.1 DUF4214 domain-containing protein [Neoroseomonas soli]
MTPECTPPADPDMRLVFLHVPKTGGTSLHAALARHFPPEAVAHVVGPADWRDALVPASRIRFVSGHTRFSAAVLLPGPLRVVTALREPVGRILSLYAFWKRHRDPSLPELREAMEKDLLGFLLSPEPQVRAAIDNAMARQIFGPALVAPDGSWVTPAAAQGKARRLPEQEVVDGALANLTTCDAVGLVEELPALYRRICAVTGMAPGSDPGWLNTRDNPPPGLGEAPAPEPLTPAIRAGLDRLTRLDRIVYEAARTSATRKAHGAPGNAPRASWSLDPLGFVDAVYRGLLGRSPTPDGLTMHAVALAEGTLAPADMLQRFAESGEFRARQASAARRDGCGEGGQSAVLR